MKPAYEIQTSIRPDRFKDLFTSATWVRLYGISPTDVVLTLDGLTKNRGVAIRNNVYNIFMQILVDYAVKDSQNYMSRFNRV